MSEKKRLRGGKGKSGKTKASSTREIHFPTPALKHLLEAIFDNCRDVEDPLRNEERRDEFVFHMTDWLSDFQRLKKMYDQPKKVDVEKASTFLIGFLYHVIPHLNAAGRLLLDEIPDPFTKAKQKV